MAKQFFDESGEQSVVKATIIAKYFWAWAKVIIPTTKQHGDKIAYLDLFAGPGRYKDGTKSTPLMVLEQAIEDADMCRMLVSMFNDKDDTNARELEKAIKALPNVNRLKHAPVVMNDEVGTGMVKTFEKMNLIPTLFFVDPWGYKGLSLDLVNSVLKDWGCDCVFFFNYNRINMGLMNPIVEEHMNCLFGEQRADALRGKLSALEPADRELEIVEALCEALKDGKEDRFVLPFRFRDAKGTRTSHHLVFVSKHRRGYEIMKGIMAKESSTHAQGVASFEYSTADKRFPMLFELNRPLDALEGMLLEEFAGKSVKVEDIYWPHNVGHRYILANYKEALKKMEAEGKVVCDPAIGQGDPKRRKNTMADHVVVKFPKQRRA
jgi:three-Cys-motif partner protein